MSVFLGYHARQDSMEPNENWGQENCQCKKEILKPMERRRQKHQRCLAHSLVGTPNYIAPEVLCKSGNPDFYRKMLFIWHLFILILANYCALLTVMYKLGRINKIFPFLELIMNNENGNIITRTNI